MSEIFSFPDFSRDREFASYAIEPRPLQAPVSRIVVSCAVDLYFRPGSASLTVAAERREDLDGVVTTLDRGTLEVRNAGVVTSGLVFDGGRVQISHAVANVTINGRRVCIDSAAPAGRVVIALSLPALPALRLSGAGQAYLLDLDQPELEVELSGAGNVRATGTVEHVRARLSGAGDMHCKLLHALSAEIRVSGAGNVKVRAAQTVRARISGAGDIRIWGDPRERDTGVSGAGTIRFR